MVDDTKSLCEVEVAVAKKYKLIKVINLFQNSFPLSKLFAVGRVQTLRKYRVSTEKVYKDYNFVGCKKFFACEGTNFSTDCSF